MSALLQVRDLTVSFPGSHGGAPVVGGVSLEVGAGEMVALVGESGSGKTVTALAVMGLLPRPGALVSPKSSIRLEGVETAGASARTMGRLRGRVVGMVFQDSGAALNPVRRVGSQLGEVLRRHRRLPRAEAGRVAEELLEEVGLPDPAVTARSFPHMLSGGMRQRALIALALAGDPRLLLADEPTSALDAPLRLQILEVLRALTRTRGLGTLLITHDLSVVAHVADRVLVMYAGEVVEAGRAADILTRPAHPYTRGLLAALPLGGRPREPLDAIPGSIPPPGDRGPGCLFTARCGRAAAACAESPPVTAVPGREGWVRCWFPHGGPA